MVVVIDVGGKVGFSMADGVNGHCTIYFKGARGRAGTGGNRDTVQL